MKVRPLPPLLDGERLIAVAPSPAPRVDPGWRRRLAFHPGRSLGHRALTAEQAHRAGRLATLGQVPSPGVVLGLEADLERVLEDGPVAYVHVAPGIGLAASGEDVFLARPLRVRLDRIPIVGPPRDPGDPGDPGVFVLLLQPATIEVVGDLDPDDPCDIDPEAFPYEDHQRVDASRLARFLWPREALGPVGFGPHTRNDLAWRVFEAERALGPGETLPWADYGVPIALVAEAGGDPTATFCDRAAVARRGGLALPRRSLVPQRGTPALWQARFEQAVQHVGDIDPAALIAEGLQSRFVLLPPVGVLPPASVPVRGDEPEPDDPLHPLPEGAVDFLPEDTLFPLSFTLEAAPMRIEAIDDVLDAAAMLDPIALFDNEHVQILVPVPEAWYDPRLLIIERVDRAFYDAIDLYLWREADRRSHRDAVWAMIAEVRRFLDGEELEAPADPGVPSLPEDWPVADPPEEEQDPLDPETDFAEAARARLRLLQDRIEALLPPTRRNLLYHSFLGSDPLEGEDLSEIDLLEYGFFGGLEAFIEGVERRVVGARERVEKAHFRVRADLFRLRQQLVQNESGTRLATSPVLGELAEKVAPATSAATLARLGEMIKAGGRADPPPPPPPPQTAFGGLGAIGGVVFQPPIAERREPVAGVAFEPIRRETVDYAPASVQFVAPLSVRLQASIAVETRDSTIDAKAVAFRAALEIEESGIALDGIPFRGVADPAELARVADGQEQDPRRSEAYLQILRRGLEFSIDAESLRVRKFVPELIRRGDLFDPLAGNDEAAFFAAGVEALEQISVWLRSIETRLRAYEKVAAAARAAFDDLDATLAAARARHQAIGVLLDEVRHDLDVALALRHEEWLRLRDVNQRRRRIIDDHVPFLVFRRPRTLEAIDAPPRRRFAPVDVGDPLPSCLEAEHYTPEPLRAMIDLVREAPIEWLPALAPLVGRLDRLEPIEALLQHARQRVEVARAWKPFAAAALDDRLGERIRALHTAQQAVVRQTRQTAVATLAPARVATWSDARRVAERHTTVGDLIDARHGRPDVARAAATTLEQIGRITACLYGRFRELPAVDRLRWIDDISQHDAAVDLRDLSVLEGFDGVADRYARRDMQQLVDWLHGRVDRGEPKAVALINELIRVALLLAGHAPVHRLITAELVEPRQAQLDVLIHVPIDPSLVRVGMVATLLGADGRTVAQGRIDDLDRSAAAIRVVQVEQAGARIERARLAEPARLAPGADPRARV